MDGLRDLKDLMEQKTKEKIQILKELKAINLDIRKKREEILKKIPKGKENLNPDKISKKIEQLEFYISTSAYTPAKEREAIRKIEELKKELQKSLENQKEWAEIKKIKAELKEITQKKRQLKGKLTLLVKELDQIYKKIINYSTNKKKFKEKKIKKEDQQQHEVKLSQKEDETTKHYLTLEDILKINQNQQKSLK
ncbi:MAG: hypothetical protein NC918_00740 [Candidatus Omnitrophica bacterium]|nr:hypothetical protein [Candidatus Omnitrophota bacterium]